MLKVILAKLEEEDYLETIATHKMPKFKRPNVKLVSLLSYWRFKLQLLPTFGCEFYCEHAKS